MPPQRPHRLAGVVGLELRNPLGSKSAGVSAGSSGDFGRLASPAMRRAECYDLAVKPCRVLVAAAGGMVSPNGARTCDRRAILTTTHYRLRHVIFEPLEHAILQVPKATWLVAMKAKSFIPARLEVRTKDGSTLIATSLILREPDLQARCLEKRELRRIVKILQERSPPPEQRGPKSTKPARSPTASSSSKRR
jgi:hypothetical protein